MSGIAYRRVAKEIASFHDDPLEGIQLEESESLEEVFVWISGAEGTIYDGEQFRLRFRFPPQYPIESPEVMFVRPDVPEHSHVYSNGHICLDILYDKWTPAFSMKTVCLSLQSMLSSAESKSRPPDNDRYVASKQGSPKSTNWWFHDEKC